MAEAEDVITDVARHATVFIRSLWQRRRKHDAGPRTLGLADVSPRIDLLLSAALGVSYPLRVAQRPARATFLSKAMRQAPAPRVQQAVPATDGATIWLPDTLQIADDATATKHYRTMALQQAMRAQRGSAAPIGTIDNPLERDVYLLLECYGADDMLARLLPGMAAPVNELRQWVLQRRPRLTLFSPARRPLESLVRTLLRSDCAQPLVALPVCALPAESLALAKALAGEMRSEMGSAPLRGSQPLMKDWWTGELRAPTPTRTATLNADQADRAIERTRPPRSARLQRRPEVRQSPDDEDDERQGAWMIQSAPPQEHVEDPVGMQRPTDRDTQTAAEDFADSLSELPEARLVSTPGRPKEVLLSDEPPAARPTSSARTSIADDARASYPEWDYRSASYRTPGATVLLQSPQLGPQQWVDQTLSAHRSILDAIRRRFEMLRAQRVTLRKQMEGEEPDLDAYIESHADFRAGLPLGQALYQTQRTARRNTAIMLLIDISGSTDAWVSAKRRVVDVEREALLLLCLALEGLAEPYAVLAFSGEGAHGVSMRAVKRFEEAYGNEVAQRIAALEPEHYTRAGAAIRHASAVLMQEPAQHRLLLLLSDGKPNDIDEYEGRYGVEDMRQAVVEAKLQGVFPFCLTIDRQAASYLAKVFGASQYALLARPELLPTVLLDWMRRLVAT